MEGVLGKKTARKWLRGINTLRLSQADDSGYPVGLAVLAAVLALILWVANGTQAATQLNGTLQAEKFKSLEKQVKTLSAGEMIRFHVIANSDSDYDQALKRAVRDAILERVAPRLAQSDSLTQSRAMLKGLLPEMRTIAEGVVKAWGQDYPVQAKFGLADFPTKSYGSLVLPAGEYQAVRIMIGRAQGSNWWCVLFPPLCFVDIDHSTAVQVDGKPGIPLKQTESAQAAYSVQNAKIAQGTQDTRSAQGSAGSSGTQGTAVSGRPVIKFWIWEMLKRLWQKL